MAFLSGPLSGAIRCSRLHRLELLRQAQEKDGNSGLGALTNRKATSSNRAPSMSSLYYY